MTIRRLYRPTILSHDLPLFPRGWIVLFGALAAWSALVGGLGYGVRLAIGGAL